MRRIAGACIAFFVFLLGCIGIGNAETQETMKAGGAKGAMADQGKHQSLEGTAKGKVTNLEERHRGKIMNLEKGKNADLGKGKVTDLEKQAK